MKLFCASAFLLLLAGCSESHGAVVDGGEDGSAANDASACGPPPSTVCRSSDGLTLHVCSDLRLSPVCSSGIWSCPSGTRSDLDCWCDGEPPAPSCVCTGSGWDCGACGPEPGFSCERPDGPPHVCSDVLERPVCVDDVWACSPGSSADAGCWCFGYAPSCGCASHGYVCPPAPCPADSMAAEGTTCGEEGRTCDCDDPCGACSALRCTSGRWSRVELPAPPDACESYACGPELRCVRGVDYCSSITSRDPSGAGSHWCTPLDPSCTAADCTCFTDEGSTCTDDDGAITVKTPASR